MQRPAGGGQLVDSASDFGSSTSGGAWCGFRRASITSEPWHPQCLSSEKASTPSISTAGFDRVKVTHRSCAGRGPRTAVVAQHDQRKLAQWNLGRELTAESPNIEAGTELSLAYSVGTGCDDSGATTWGSLNPAGNGDRLAVMSAVIAAGSRSGDDDLGPRS